MTYSTRRMIQRDIAQQEHGRSYHLRKTSRPICASKSTPDRPAPDATLGTAKPDDVPDESALGGPRAPLRALIVEDELIIAMELEMILEELNVEVVGIAINATEAEAIVAATKPDCITMDINIQGDRDGVVTARDIYEKYGIRSIFVSAYGNAAMRILAAPANPLGWVRKPIEKEDLQDILLRLDAERP